MRHRPTTDLGPIDAAGPVDRGHPINRGRLAWWLVLPHLAGGGTLVNLMGGLYPAILTGMAAGGWRPTKRPGGWGEILFAGGYCRAARQFPAAGGFTVAAWVRLDSSAFQYLVSNAVGAAGWALYYFGGAYSFRTWTAGTVASTTAVTMAAGGWRFVVARYNPATATQSLWVDGVVATTTGVSAPAPGGSTTQLGIHEDLSGAPLVGALDDVSIADRAWSDAEAAAASDLSRRGYPGVLNRAGPAIFRFNLPIILAPTPIASGESLGAASLSGAGAVAPASVATGESLGAASLSGSGSVAPTPVATGESFGAAVLSAAGSVAPTPIATGESLASPALSGSGSVAPPSIASGEAFGSTVLTASATLAPPSIASGEAFGSTVLTASATLAPGSIASGEAFGMVILAIPLMLTHALTAVLLTTDDEDDPFDADPSFTIEVP